MRNVFKRKTVGLFLCSFIVTVLLTSISTFADDKLLMNHAQKKEILVERDVTLEPPLWCGNNAFLIVDKEEKLIMIDFLNSKREIISNPHNVTIEACTSDGEWLLYSNRQSVRWDKNSYERGVIDFWRYNFKTGKRQKFAVACDGSDIVISLDGKKILFSGPKPRSFIKQPAPEWELLWSKGKWEPGRSMDPLWLNDSSKIVILSNNKLFIEEPDKNTIHQFNSDLGLLKNLRIDRFNRIYALASPKPPNMKTDLLKYRLIRCSIKDKNLECEDLISRDKSIARYDMTPDGKNIVFIEGGKSWKENTCVWYLSEGREAECITSLADINSSLSISPDGRWATYARQRKKETVRGVDVYTNDLFVIKLKNE